jgi:hypothetical protein
MGTSIDTPRHYDQKRTLEGFKEKRPTISESHIFLQTIDVDQKSKNLPALRRSAKSKIFKVLISG